MPAVRRTLLSAVLSAVLIALALVPAIPAADASRAPASWISGIGASSLADPAAAADEAAAQAKAGLGGRPAKLVMVTAAEPQVTPELIEGVKRHFPAEVIHGSQVTSPLSPFGNHADCPTIDVDVGVAVWALAGDTDVTMASVRTDVDEDDVYYNAGVRLAEQLKTAVESSTRPGRLVLTFGDQYNGSNKDFASGLNDGFEQVWPIIGGAAGNVTAKVIHAGEIRTGINLGFVIAGDFTVGQAMGEGSHTPETADRVLGAAVEQGDGKEPFFAFIFNCRRRRTGMIERNQLGDELDVMRRRLNGSQFFGFYGPGEIGADAPGEAARGMGFTVVTAVLFPE